MIGIVLTILKIIGIIILILIALILVLLGIVLFNPIRYKASGSFLNNDPKVKFRATYFLGLARFNLVFENSKLVYKARIAFKTLVDSEKADTDAKPKSKKAKKDDSKSKKTKVDESKDPLDDSKLKIANLDGENIDIDNIHVEVKKESRLKRFFRNICNKLKKIKFKILQICDRIKSVFETYESYRDFLTTEESRVARKEIKSRVFKILKAIKPKKLKARLRFGFEDPALTGQVLGALSILYPIYGDNLILEAEFLDVEQMILEGEFKLKGRIRVITLLIQFFKIYRNKRLKEFISFIKTGGN